MHAHMHMHMHMHMCMHMHMLTCTCACHMCTYRRASASVLSGGGFSTESGAAMQPLIPALSFTPTLTLTPTLTP